MHRSKSNGLMFVSSLAAALSLSGVALADNTTKSDAAKQQEPKKAEVQAEAEVKMRAEPTEVAIQGSPDQIKEMQRQLASRGFYQGNIDGVAGAKTRSALRNFQIQQGISVEGGLNAQTRDSLGLYWDRQPVKGSDEPQPAPARGDATRTQTRTPRTDATEAQPGTPADATTRVKLSSLNNEHTKAVQQRLQELGFYRGPVDGVFGPGTRAGLMRYFQRQAQLASQGLIDDSAIGAFGIEENEVKRVSGEDAKTE